MAVYGAPSNSLVPKIRENFVKKVFVALTVVSLAGCVTTESAIHSFNGETVEVELYGDTFAYGSKEDQQAQLDAARLQAEEVCGGNARFLSRRMEAQPQNGIYYVPSRNLALFQCT